MFSVRFSEEIEKRLAHLAAETERSKSFHVHKALEAYLEDQEDYLLADAVKMRLRSGQEKSYSLEEVEEILNHKNG